MRYFILFIFLLGFHSTFAASADTALVTEGNFGFPDRTIKVGLKISEPFIFEENGVYRGLSVKLWEQVADDLDLNYEYIAFADLEQLLLAIENGEVDLSINPLTVTAPRLEKMDFTQPFFITNLAIAYKKERENKLLLFLKNLFSWEFFTAIALLTVVILAFGLLTWFFERRENKEQFTNNSRGVWEAFWWSAVTMTTVGYGDKAPKTIGGRIVGIVWMFTAIVIISGFTASIASSLTVDVLSADVNSLEDLRKARVVTVNASSADGFLERGKYSYSKVSNAYQGLEAITSGRADAMVYDEPIMQYEITENEDFEKIKIASAKFFTQYYAFAIPLNRTYLKKLNLSLIQEIKSNEWKAELGRYRLE